MYSDLSKRLAYATSGCVYNTTSDFPTSGSGFGVNTQALTLYAGFVIPEYSRICFMNYGNSNDGALTAVSPSGDIYSAFRNGGVWQNGKISATKNDLWPQNSGVEITAGTDMQTITTPGHYYCSNNSTTALLKNCPISDAFTLVVYRSAGGTEDNIYYVTQEYTSYLCNKRVIQTYNKDSKNWTTHEIQFKS